VDLGALLLQSGVHRRNGRQSKRIAREPWTEWGQWNEKRALDRWKMSGGGGEQLPTVGRSQWDSRKWSMVDRKQARATSSTGVSTSAGEPAGASSSSPLCRLSLALRTVPAHRYSMSLH